MRTNLLELLVSEWVSEGVFGLETWTACWNVGS